MAEPRRLERLTAQDLLMLLADDFGWSEDIGVLAILDGTRLLDADGRVRVDEVRRRLEPRPTWCRASGSCCTGRDGDWAGLVGRRPHLRPRRPRAGPPGAGTSATRPSCWAACARLYRRRLDPTWPPWQAWPCSACRSGGSACSSASTTPWWTAWPMAALGRCWT